MRKILYVDPATCNHHWVPRLAGRNAQGPVYVLACNCGSRWSRGEVLLPVPVQVTR